MPNDFTAENNCVALYRFESGGFADDSKGTNDLTDVNTVTVETTLYKEGAQAAKHVRSASEYFTCADSALSSDFPGKSGTSNGSLSFCAWVRFTSLASGRGFANKLSGSSGSRGWSLSIGASLNLNLTKGLASDASATETLSHGTGFVTGRWYHVGVTYNNTDKTSRIRIWDDTAGAILGTDATTTFSDYIYIGGAGFTLGSNHDGIFDEVVVFNRALTADEIDSIRSGEFGSGTSNTQVTTSPGTLGLSGPAPSSAFSGAITSALEPGLLDLTGHPAQSAFSGAITSATLPGSLAFSGLAGQIIVSGAATVTVLTAAGALGLTGAAPSAAYSGTVRAQTLPGLLALAGVAPGLLHSGAVTVELLAGELSIDGQAVETTIGGGIRVETAAGLLSLLGEAPSVVISGGVRVETQPGALDLSGAAPVMIHAGLIEIVTGAGGLGLDGQPTVVQVRDASLVVRVLVVPNRFKEFVIPTRNKTFRV